MFLRIFALCALLVSAFTARTATAAPFEIKEGDRVLFLGDTLIEREGTYGYLETRLQEQFRDRHFTVRNLGFSADTPLGWSRASFDPATKGLDRLKEQIALVKPNVVFLGYGMAASLQELTDRRNDPTMNPDPARYGTEPMSAERFKKELGQLMDAIIEISGPTRFVLLSPIKHEDLRATRPGLPDPARHNALIEQYTKAIEELAKERTAQFVNVTAFISDDPAKLATTLAHDRSAGSTDSTDVSITTNGIHLTETGYRLLEDTLFKGLGFAPRYFGATANEGWDPKASEQLRAAIIHKNELFFHRWRPANSTYLFGFRKHEQGQNAKEIPEFDPLIEKAEAEIDQLKKSVKPTAVAAQTPAPAAAEAMATLPKPDFTVAEGFQIELWAENPLLYKPTQMNWDAQGRLWVASSALYPQIAPGGEATDTILVLEDTDRDGKADKSTVFAGGLLIPTAVQPSYLPRKDGSIHYGCYVGQSTELLYFEDTNGDGKADKKQILLSGFGTEDTHHIIHTLRRGPDRRLYFNQSVYIHSHIETPWGVIRLNSGGVFAWDPRTEKVEVVSKGLWNTWGHQFDQWGQSFQTDGAGSTGITWSFPGAIFAPFEGSRRTMQSISPGSYPKFAGLELISSPHFPADWQTNAITCDFRAHRVVRFGITDLSLGEKPQAGYTTQELPDVVRTSDVAFRPIDVKLGPDGALYVADWSNPVINHGEVDFRDPRRDHTHGRIWRITRKDAPVVKWESLVAKKNPELLDKLLSPNLWEKEQARAVLGKRLVTEVESKKLESQATGQLVLGNVDDASALPDVQRWYQQDRSDDRLREVALLESAFSTTGWGRFPKLLESTPGNRALIARLTAGMRSRATASRPPGAPATPAPNADRPAPNLYSLPRLARDPNPRVRLEALRVLGRSPGMQAIELILDAGVNAAEDPFLDHAAWLAINESSHRWLEAINNGQWKIEGREKQLEYGLNAIDPRLAGQAIARLLNDGKIKLNEGPWIELVGRAGGPPELAALFESLIISFGADCCPGRNMTAKQATSLSEPEALRTISALLEAVRVRSVLPEGELSLSDLATHAPVSLRPGLTQLAGYWKTKDALNFLPEVATTTTNKPELRVAAIDALRVLGGAEAAKVLASLCEPSQSFGIRRTALTALAAANLGAASKLIPAVLHDATVENEALATWRGLLAVQGGADALARKVGEGTWAKDLPPIPLAAGVRAAREGGRKAQPLLAALTPIAGITAAPNAPVDYKGIAERTKKDGDPAQGELIYRRATTGCTTCHAIGGAGGIVGPSLTSIGASAPLDYIVESMLAPNAKVKEGYNAVTLKLKDGTEATGIQARETAQEVILRNIAGQETVVPKASITGKTDVGSIMPQGLLEPLSERDRLNLYAFLAELGKPGPYDASKGNVARVWRLYPGVQEKLALKQDVTGYVPPAYTHVDGRLSQAALTEMLPMLVDDGKTFYATAQFQVANAGKVRLSLLGISTAWLDGQPLAIASEPNPSPELGVGVHTITVKLDRTALPAVLRAEADGVNFLGN